MQNRPWHIWWDFSKDDHGDSCVVLETCHPKLNGVLYRYKIEDVMDEEGYIDTWERNCFHKMVSEITTGRVSIMKLKEDYYANHTLRNLK